MLLIVGLGNPGEKYQNTRHNIGLRVIGKIAAYFESSDSNNAEPIFNSQKISSAQICKGEIAGKKVLLAKLLTFMNLSGKTIAEIAGFYKIKPKNIIIIHDDIDLPLGKIRIAENRGAAGHKGVQSVINHLKTKNFIRLRVGVCPEKGKPGNPERFVLQKFNEEEEEIAKEVIKKTAEAVNAIIKQGIGKAQSKYNY